MIRAQQSPTRGVLSAGRAARRLRAARVAIVVVCAVSPVPASAQEARSTHISQADLVALIERGNAPVILDVRSRREYERGHVPGALHMPFWAVAARASVIPSARDRPIVVYCQHGPRAGMAKLALRARGFTDVVYLEGHMAAWQASSLPEQVWRPAS